MANILITQGTATNLPVDLIGTVNYPIAKLDIGALGASVPFTGTLGAVTNVAGGTIGVLTAGTITGLSKGTISTGTVDAISQFPPNQWGTNVVTTGSALGTIKAAVAGSAIFITDLIISAGSTTSLFIGMGGSSTPFMANINLGATGGFVSNFRVPGSITSGSALVYQQTVPGTLSIYATGFVR